jgi:hypothetical protein
MGLTSETIVFQRGRFRRKTPVRTVFRVGRRAGIRHVIAVREERAGKVERELPQLGLNRCSSHDKTTKFLVVAV